MKKEECRMKKLTQSTLVAKDFLLHSAFCILHML
jgi:hypothetical protein